MAKLVPNLAIDIFWGASIYQLTNIFLFARGAIANFPGGLFLYIYIYIRQKYTSKKIHQNIGYFFYCANVIGIKLYTS